MEAKEQTLQKVTDGNIHVVPTDGEMDHLESKDCWCVPTMIQEIDSDHRHRVFTHKGYKELNQ